MAPRVGRNGFNPGRCLHVMTGEAATYEVAGHKVACPICGSDCFRGERVPRPRRGLTVLAFDWPKRGRYDLICNECSHVQTFAQEGLVVAGGA